MDHCKTMVLHPTHAVASEGKSHVPMSCAVGVVFALVCARCQVPGGRVPQTRLSSFFLSSP
jgi:hypothetical protein